jgi:hypothetical protein
MDNNDQIKKNRKAEKNQAKRLAIIKAEERVFTRKWISRDANSGSG